MTRSSTQYYRDNRISRRIIYHCPHCNYETANCRISLIHHIHAKHTPESEKPYQCPECERGFAQKAQTRGDTKIKDFLHFLDTVGK